MLILSPMTRIGQFMASSKIWAFHPTKASLCVMMRENLKTKSCKYIAVYLDNLCIASPKQEDIVNTVKAKYIIKINADYHLGAKYPNDPGATMICQLKKYIEELHENFTNLFNKDPPEDLETVLDKIDLLSVYHVIMQILITKANPTLMPKEGTDDTLNDISRKRKRCNHLHSLTHFYNKINEFGQLIPLMINR